MSFSRTQVGLLLALLLGNAIVLYSNLELTWLRFPAAVVLTFVLPGWAWLAALGWLQTNDAIERLVLVIGFSSVLSALALLIALLLPGPFTETPNLIALNLATLTGLLYPLISRLKWRMANGEWRINLHARQTSSPISTPVRQAVQSPISWPPRTILLILLVIVAVAAVTRLTRLGYAEFHEDELENMRLIVRAYKGEEYAPFLDSKGPIHWLLPAALWYLNGWVNEGIARTPFAITSLLLIPLVYSLGRRMSGRDSIGLLAAGFVAVNGFFVGYARFVENQSLIVFWGALAMWFAYRAYRENINSFLVYVALLLAIGLIAHPDVLLYLPVFAYLVWLHVRHNRRAWPWLGGAGVLFVALVALFYVPYLLDPQIGLIYQYFGSDRIGEALFYNRVDNLFDQDQLYSTRYHAPFLIVLLAWLLARYFARGRWLGWLLLSGLGLAILSTVALPNSWLVGNFNLAFVPYALLVLSFMLLPYPNPETKIIFLWFSLPLGPLLFLAKDAADHIQIAYPAWALLAALALADLWTFLSGDGRRQTVDGEESSSFRLPAIPSRAQGVYRLPRAFIPLSLAILVPLILFYQYLSFDALVTTYWRAKIDSEDNPKSIYNLLYGSLPRPRKIFSNPRLAGWKAVGYLWTTGALTGDFRSINESFAVPIWYTLQTPRSCYDDPQNYWVRRDWKSWPEEEQAIVDQGYSLTRVVLVDQEPMLHLYEKNAPSGEPEVLDSEAYRQAFDWLMTPARLAHNETINYPASYNFGDKLLLRGYDLPQTPTHPGDLLPVTIYWESLAPMDLRYRSFIHLVGADETRWGQHDDDPACRLLTSEMRPGQRSSRQFRLPVDPATPPGNYRLIFGVYDPATSERLPIWDNLANQSPGNSLILGQVRVE